MRKKFIVENYTTDWPPAPPISSANAPLLQTDDISRIRTKTDLEKSWREFIRWIGFSELIKCMKRKELSIDQGSLRLVANNIYSVEIGLSNILRRWSAFRKLAYPKDSSVYNAYSFIQTCIELRRELTEAEAAKLRSRIVANLLPAGRISDIDLELQAWRSLRSDGKGISHFGVLGDPGPDFLINRGGQEIEIECKCISPEIGMPLSYGLVSSVLHSSSESLKGRYPGKFVYLQVEITKSHPNLKFAKLFKDQIIATYLSGQNIVTDDIVTNINFRPLSEIIDKFRPVETNTQAIFSEYRRQHGDFGLFTGDDSECVFLNLIPLTNRRTLKRTMAIISDACEQFSKTRPSILWLHLLAMPDTQSNSEDEGMIDFFDRLLGHAFESRKREHLSLVIFSSDTRLHQGKTLGIGKAIRLANGKNHKRFYQNPNARFPLFDTVSNRHARSQTP